jgi:hypothetical protein
MCVTCKSKSVNPPAPAFMPWAHPGRAKRQAGAQGFFQNACDPSDGRPYAWPLGESWIESITRGFLSASAAPGTVGSEPFPSRIKVELVTKSPNASAARAERLMRPSSARRGWARRSAGLTLLGVIGRRAHVSPFLLWPAPRGRFP